ncbi:MAG TPA: hypothetical protein VFV50_02280, partial [Bdellovibrionales bacterium]|nr:hypothetical protein [Bdellovibrionales bacterium]
SLLILTAFASLTACSFQGMETVQENSSVKAADYNPNNLTQALRIAASRLVLRAPTASEYDEASTGVDGYSRVIQRYLTDPRFASPQIAGNPDPEIAARGGALLQEHRNYFEQAGAEGTINRNEPANIASFVVINDRPYWEVLTASYCVDNTFQSLSRCDTYNTDADAQANAAGIITTRAWIRRNKTPYNFHIVNMSFQKFLCSNYPDPQDPGMPKELISERKKTFTSNNNAGMDCYFCHRSVNPKAWLFYKYNGDAVGGVDNAGKFNPLGFDQPRQRTTFNDDANPGTSLPEDVVCEKNADGTCRISTAATPVIPNIMIMGKPASTVRDLGRIMVQDSRFADCATQHYLNWMFGLDSKTKLPDDMRYLVEVFKGDPNNQPYNVKRLILEISKSAKFVNR